MKQTTWIKADLPIHYHVHRPTTAPRAIALFLHGYTDHGASFFRRLFPNGWPHELRDIAWIAPNGPFPVPVKTPIGWREAYSWYFYDMEAEKMVIPPDTSLSAIEAILDLHFPEGHSLIPKLIVGFSQGGFLAPMLARRLPHTKELVTVGTGYRPEYYHALPPLTVTAVHGTTDEVFPSEDAIKAHQSILELGHRGQFHTIANTGHIATEAMGTVIQQQLAQLIHPGDRT